MQILDLDDNQLEIIFAGTFSNMNQLRKLVLSNNNLVFVHSFELPSLLYFDVSSNNLTDFPLISTKSLEHLVANNNPLVDIPYRNVMGLRRLKSADFSNCLITKFDYTIFRHSQALETLNLDKNQIKIFVDIRIPNLKKLVLSSNKISNISTRLDVLLPKLKILNLQSNQMRTVNRDVLSNTTVLKLDLSLNPFWCDCELVPFTNWVDEHKRFAVGIDNWECSYPRALQHKMILDAVATLNCDSAPEAKQLSIVLIVVTGVVAVIFLLFSAYVVTVCVKSKRAVDVGQPNGSGYEIRESRLGRFRLWFCCRRNSSQDQGNLVSASATSPSQKDAPTSL